MKRRKFITAVGTVGVGSGMALGTGAFDAASANSDGQLSIVTQSEDANLDVVPGTSISGVTAGGDVIDGSSTGNEYIDSNNNIQFDNLSLDDLPLAIAKDAGQGMANVQVAVAAGTPSADIDFSNLLVIQNNDSVEYNVGFSYTTYGDLDYTEYGETGTSITKSTVNTVFQFQDADSSLISPATGTDGGTSPANKTSITDGGNEPVSLVVNADDSGLVGAIGNVYDKPYDGAGDFGSDAALREPLVEEITAVADQV